MTTENKIRVLVIDDSEAIRRSLKQFLQAFRDLEWIGESNSDQDTLMLCEQLHPDVVLLDASLLHADVAQLISQILQGLPHTHVIGLTSFEEQAVVDRLLQAGAALCLSKNTNVTLLAAAVRQTMDD